jgi:thiol-disulfide isomerase/thioredoxin
MSRSRTAFVAFVTSLGLLACQRGTSVGPMPLTDEPLALLARPTLAGENFDAGALAGKVVLLNFWSPGCGYCVKELPDLQKVARELGADQVELVTVVINDQGGQASDVVAELGLAAPVLVADAELSRQFRVDAVPWTVVIGKDGKAKQVLRGTQAKGAFRDAAKALL